VLRRNEAELNFMEMSQTTMRRTSFDLQVSTEECIMRDSAITLVIVDLTNSKLQTWQDRGTQ